MVVVVVGARQIQRLSNQISALFGTLGGSGGLRGQFKEGGGAGVMHGVDPTHSLHLTHHLLPILAFFHQMLSFVKWRQTATATLILFRCQLPENGLLVVAEGVAREEFFGFEAVEVLGEVALEDAGFGGGRMRRLDGGRIGV